MVTTLKSYRSLPSFLYIIPTFGLGLLFLCDPVPLFKNAIGRLDIDPAALTRYANSSALNNDHCTVNYAADACEDVKIHFQSSTAFLACGNPEARTHWYPPSGRHNADGRPNDTFREFLFKYDIKTKRTTKLKIEGLGGDFITHGMDIYSLPGNPGKIHIFAVNHARSGDSISIFSHILGSDSVQLVEDVKHPGIKTANGVAAAGPLDFFITNDHYFTSKAGALRIFEEKNGPWSWATHVQYCDASGGNIVCRQVSDTFPGANGILIWEDELYVGDCRSGVARIFKIKPNMSLAEVKTVNLGGAADNINIIPTTGDLIITLFPNIEQLPVYLNDVHALGKDALVPSCVVRLIRSKDFKPELIYWDDGSVLSYMTVAAVEPSSNVLINGAVLQYGGFAVCKLPKESLL